MSGKINIELDLKETGCENEDSIQLTQDMTLVAGFCEHVVETQGSINGGQFRDPAEPFSVSQKGLFSVQLVILKQQKVGQQLYLTNYLLLLPFSIQIEK